MSKITNWQAKLKSQMVNGPHFSIAIYNDSLCLRTVPIDFYRRVINVQLESSTIHNVANIAETGMRYKNLRLYITIRLIEPYVHFKCSLF